MSELIPKHGGYRKLKSFQVIRAAGSGVQNIAEGSQASATSKKTELKLTQVARASVSACESPCQSMPSVCLAANAALSLLNLSCYLLDRQAQRLANDFENEGGFTERLYRFHSAKRRNKS
jgi:four helix bundle suffix protein